MIVKLNDNEKLVKEIRDKIKKNGGHCISKSEKTEDTICMCQDFRELIEARGCGMCDCKLYVLEQD